MRRAMIRSMVKVTKINVVVIKMDGMIHVIIVEPSVALSVFVLVSECVWMCLDVSGFVWICLCVFFCKRFFNKVERNILQKLTYNLNID